MALLAATLLASCGGHRGDASPANTELSQSLAAQREARGLESAWREGDDKSRSLLLPALRAFIERHPTDPRVRRMRLYLARLQILAGALDEATAQVQAAASDAGSPQLESCALVSAALSNRRGQAAEALKLLAPLAGRLIDPDERSYWGAEMIAAALATGKTAEAWRAAERWLLEASEDQQAAAQQAASSLALRLAQPELLVAFRELEQELELPTQQDGRQRGRRWLLGVVRRRLAQEAIKGRDSALARRLLDSEGETLPNLRETERLRKVAAQQVVSHRAGRVLGLLVELNSEVARRRSSDVVTGVMRALSEESGTAGVRLTTREASAREGKALVADFDALAADGATVIIAGLEGLELSTIASVAEREQLAVITLQQRSVPAPLFGIGFDLADLMSLTVGAASLVNADASLCLEPAMALAAGSNWLALGGCLDKVVSAARTQHPSPAVWLGPSGLEELGGACPSGFAGCLQPAAARDASLVASWRQHAKRLPSWFEALGHDAAVLAAPALASLPEELVLDETRIHAERRRVTAELQSARARLWTSESQGFAADRTLSRRWAVVTEPQRAKAAR